MSAKIVERLGYHKEDHNGVLRLANPDGPEAADFIEAQAKEIERLNAGWRKAFDIGTSHQTRREELEARVAVLEAALQPFAAFAEDLTSDGGPLLGQYIKIKIEIIPFGGEHDIQPSAFRAAARALAKETKP